MTDQKCVWIDLCSRLRGSNKNLEGAFGMHNLISPTFLLLQKIPQQAAKKKYLTGYIMQFLWVQIIVQGFLKLFSRGLIKDV